MSIKTHKAQVKTLSGLSVEVQARGFKVIVDEPEDHGGTNNGMNPVELMLCSLGSCEVMSICMFASYYGIKIDEIKLELEGDIDPDGFSGVNPNIRAGFQTIRFHYYIKTDASEARINQLMKITEKNVWLVIQLSLVFRLKHQLLQ